MVQIKMAVPIVVVPTGANNASMPNTPPHPSIHAANTNSYTAHLKSVHVSPCLKELGQLSGHWVRNGTGPLAVRLTLWNTTESMMSPIYWLMQLGAMTTTKLSGTPKPSHSPISQIKIPTGHKSFTYGAWNGSPNIYVSTLTMSYSMT